jgi:glycosyltransferase involved in cell wall biosynthesis
VSPFDRGGIQRHVAEISKALSREGVEVHLFIVGKALGINRALYPGTPLEDTQMKDGFHVHPVTVLPTPRLTLGEYLSYSLNAARHVKGFNLDLIHGQSMYSFGCAVKKRFPMVVTIQGPQIVEYKTELASKATLNHKVTDAAAVIMEAYAARKADRLIVDSQESKRTVMEKYGIEESKIRVIVKEGVNVEDFTQSSCESNTILFVGRLHQRKGLDLFLPVFKDVLKEQEAVLKIVGSGEKEKSLKQQVERLGIKEHVKFTGYLPDPEMRREYSSASIFVSPSRYEGFGITLLEALASGLPIVATDTGIAGSVVEEGRNGFVVDHEHMKEAILGLLGDGLQREQFGARSRQIAKKYTWESAAKRMIEIYRELV